MSKEASIELKNLPSLMSLYRKIFFVRKPGWDQQPLPHIQVQVPQVKVHADKVTQYAKVCGFQFDGINLPLTYLYVKAFRLHATIFTDEQITFPLLGMIHLKNSISQYRPLTINDVFDLKCRIKTSRMASAGLEFDIISEATIDGELVWQACSTYLYRIEGQKSRVRPPKAAEMDWSSPLCWQLDEDTGRRYAKASGDYNLIHLHPLLSKRFGFDRVLAHGMWSKARCVAQLMPHIGDKPCRIDVEFKLPVFMPATVQFGAQVETEGWHFELRDQRGRRPHLTGQVTFIS
ncbi:MaoC family dehydratase [Shewanella marina]|uniref:MaoC family dehydratase n=1 Tax=Shewanella marina TaxID=487319 RepID=UPI00046E84E8